MKKKLILLFSVLFLITSMLFVVTGCKPKEEVGTGKYWKLDTEQTEFVFEVGDQFTVPFAYIVDSIEDRVDGIEVSYKVQNATGGDIVVKKDVFRFPTRAGICKIIYSAEGMEDYVIDCYVCAKLPTPKDFTVSGNTISWPAVKDAKNQEKTKYIIRVNMGEEQTIEGTSFTSDVFSGTGWCFEAKAIGDRETSLDSPYGLYQNRKPLQDNELVAFNDVNYAFDIQLGDVIGASVMPDPIEYVSEQECPGSNGGALKLGLYSGEYGHSIFKVMLTNPFDTAELPENGGIEVRFKLKSEAYVFEGTTTPTRFQFLKPSQATWIWDYGERELNPDNDDTWQTLRIPSANIQGVYLAGTITEAFHFNVYNMRRGGGYGELFFDYIRVYEGELGIPVLADNNGVITWDAVENATGYKAVATVDNNGTIEEKTFDLTTNSLDLTDYAQYYVQVQALSSNVGWLSSPLSSPLCNYKASANQMVIGEFNSKFYQGTIVEGGYLYRHPEMQTKLIDKVEYSEENGALALTLNTSNSTRYSNFRINFNKGLDFSAHDGVKVKFKVTEHPYGNDAVVKMYYIADNSNWNEYSGSQIPNGGQEFTVGEWCDFVLPITELDKYIDNGDSYITLSITRASGGLTTNGTVKVFISEVSYYDKLDVPTGVALNGNILSWTAVENADGYIVTINGQEKDVVTTNSIDLTSYADVDYSATVKAVSNSRYFLQSENSESVIKLTTEAHQLASNNSVACEGTIVPGGYHYKTPTLGYSFIEDVKYSAQESALELTLNTNNTTRFATFRANLVKGMDFTNHDGIKIKFKVTEHPYGDSAEVWFTFVGDSGNWNESGGNFNTPHQVVTVGEWQVLTLSNAELDSMLNDGDKYITLSVLQKSNVQNNGTVKVFLGEICYYDDLSVPMNAELDGNTFSWNAVANADGYVVCFNGVDQPVTTATSMDLTTLTNGLTAYRVSVKAVSNAMTLKDSAYTEEIKVLNEPASVLASYNDQIYTSMVGQLDADSVISKVEYLSANADDGFGGHDGAIQVTINQGTYTYMPMLALNLANTLDLTTNSQVKVRMRVVSYPNSLEQVNVYVAYDMPNQGDDYSPVKYNDNHGTLTVGGDWTEITLNSTLNNSKMVDLYNGTKLLGIGFGSIKANGEPVRYDQGGTIVIQIDYVKY